MVKREKNGILKAPIKPINIPEKSQWLAGQGAGSWFYIKKNLNGNFNIKRFSPNGVLEFDSEFNKTGTSEFCLDCPYVFTYLSHYKQCNIIQHGEKIVFINILN